MKPRRLRHVSAQELAYAAVRWNDARHSAITLRAQRRAFVCEYEGACLAPCWRSWWEDNRCQPTQEDQSGWCRPCQAREAVHQQYRQAVQRRGSRERAVMQLANMAVIAPVEVAKRLQRAALKRAIAVTDELEP